MQLTLEIACISSVIWSAPPTSRCLMKWRPSWGWDMTISNNAIHLPNSSEWQLWSVKGCVCYINKFTLTYIKHLLIPLDGNFFYHTARFIPTLSLITKTDHHLKIFSGIISRLCAGQIGLTPSPPGQPQGQRKNVC